MKNRQYKKLCLKAAQAMGFKDCAIEDGIYYVSWSCGGYDSEWDSEDAWVFLMQKFDGAVNTMINENSECGISWKPENQCLKSTPKNVLAWAKTQKQLNNLF